MTDFNSKETCQGEITTLHCVLLINSHMLSMEITQLRSICKCSKQIFDKISYGRTETLDKYVILMTINN